VRTTHAFRCLRFTFGVGGAVLARWLLGAIPACVLVWQLALPHSLPPLPPGPPAAGGRTGALSAMAAAALTYGDDDHDNDEE
jgi:hypothetical protein